MIHVSQLTKHFGSILALDSISFEVHEREVVGFLGPNGAGKTTTLRILTGFLPGDSGTVRVAGFDVAQDSLAVRRSIGYLPEGVPLYPEMRVREFLRFRARLKGIPRPGRRQAIRSALELARVSDVEKRIVGTLSRGYRQRVGLADALLGKPPVLILDEPTVGLDPEQVIQFRGLLRDVGRDRTVILSTHILSEVEMVCSSALIIHRGRIAAQDTAANLRRRVQAASPVRAEIAGPAAEVRAALASLSEVEKVLEESEAEEGPAEQETPGGGKSGRPFRRYRLRPRRGQDPRQAIFQLARQRGWTLRELYREQVTLEEAFLEIVGKPASQETV